jgi:ABC-type uncharacterized transport system involved in gliding motility auxiliary subunit
MTALLVALGIFVSSFFASQISAFLVSALAAFLLVIAGSEIMSTRFPLFLAPFLEQLSVSNHFDSMARGVIDLRDLWYFLSFSAAFLALAALNLLRGKFGNRKSAYRNYQVAFLFLVGIAILTNVVGANIPGRIDLTEDKIYTLSPATKRIAAGLPDIVTVSLFASDALPAQLQPVLRETKDLLDDYENASDGKVRVAVKNPSTDSAAAEEALSLGVQPVRFNVVSQEEFQVKDGYLGIALSYGGEHEAIPFVENMDDLEYQLSSLLRKLTNENKAKVGYLSGHGEKSLFSDYAKVSAEWKKQFAVEEIAAKSEDPAPAKKGAKNEPAVTPVKSIVIPETVTTLIVAGPNQVLSEGEREVLADFLARGGNALFLIDGVTVSTQMMNASGNEQNLADFVKEKIGIEVKKDMVYDLRSNEAVSFSNGPRRYVLPYPFWVRALRSGETSPITTKLESALIPWPSSLDTSGVGGKGYDVTALFATTDAAGAQTASFTIVPDQTFAREGLERKTLAAALVPTMSGSGRIIVIGDSDLFTDQFIGNSPGNLVLALSALSWLAEESDVSQVAVRNITERKLVFAEKSEPDIVKFGNLGFVLLSVSGYGFFRLWRRRRMKDWAYGDIR